MLALVIILLQAVTLESLHLLIIVMYLTAMYMCTIRIHLNYIVGMYPAGKCNVELVAKQTIERRINN